MRLALFPVLLLVVGSGVPFALAKPVEPPPHLYAFGYGGSGRVATSMAYDGAGVRTFSSCVLLNVNPATNFGFIRFQGLWSEAARFQLLFENFEGTQAIQDGGLATDISDDGRLAFQRTTYPSSKAIVAGWGRAFLLVNDERYPDPVTARPNWSASFALVNDGFRDNVTNAIPTTDGRPFDPSAPAPVRSRPGYPELHVFLRNHTGRAVGEETIVFRNAGTAGTAYTTNPAYRADHPFPNFQFGGKASFEIAQTSPVSSPLTYIFRDPLGKELANETLGATGGPEERRTVSFGLAEFGAYNVEVSGRAVATQYSITGTLVPPATASLNFWWTHVTTGYQAVRLMNQCSLENGEFGFTPNLQFTPPRPPGMTLAILVVGVAGAIVMALFLVKLVMDQVSTGAFAKFSRGR